MAERSLTVAMSSDTSGFSEGMQQAKKILTELNQTLLSNQSQLKTATQELNNFEKEQQNLQAEMEKSGGDTEENRKKMEELTSQIKSQREKVAQLKTEQTDLRNQISNATKALKEETEAYKKQKEASEKLRNTISEQQEKLTELEAQYNSVVQAQGENSKEAEELAEVIKQLSSELSENQKRLENVEYSTGELSEEVDNTSDSVEEANEKFTAWKVMLGNLASDTLENLLSKLKDIAVSVIETGEEFSSAMSEVQALSGATNDELEQLEQTAREYGSTTQFSATEAAEALKYMALAGWDTEQSMSALGGILDLAAASGMDLAEASDMVTDYLSAFGMEAEESAYFADLLAYAQANSNTSAEQLGEAYGNCAATLNAAGQDIETVTSLLEAMANQGLKGSSAGTSLAAVMRDITNNMSDGKIAIGNTNITVADASGNFRDLTDILTDVSAALDGMGTAEGSAALSATFTADSIKGVNLILNEGIESVADYEEALRSSSGTASETAEAINDNLSGDIANLNSALDELKLKIYDGAEGPLRNLVQTITEDGVPALEVLIENLDKILPVVAAATTAFVGFKASVGLQTVIDTVSASFKGMTAAKTADTIATTANTASTAGNTTASSANTAAKTADSAATSALTVATNGATVAQTGLNAAMSANPAMLVITGIATLVSLFGTLILMTDNATESTEKYLEAIEAVEESGQNTVAEAQTEATTIEFLAQQYDELREKTNLTVYEQNKLESISEQLADRLGITTDELKDQSGAYVDLSEQIQQVTEDLINQAKLEAAQNILTEAYEQQAKAYDDLIQKTDELIEEGKIVEDENGELSYTTSDVNDEYVALGKTYDEITSKVADYEQQLSDAIAAVGSTASSTAAAVETAAEVLDKISKAAENAADNIETLEEVNDSLVDTLSDVISIEDDLQSVIDEVTESNTLSLSTLNSLQKEYPELIDVVNEYIAGRKTEAEVIEAMQEVYVNDVNAYNDAVSEKIMASEEFYSAFVNSNAEAVNELLDMYGVDLTNFATAMDAKVAIAKSAAAQIAAIQTVNGYALGMSNGSTYYMDESVLSDAQKSAMMAAFSSLGIDTSKGFSSAYATFQSGNYNNTSNFSELMAAAGGSGSFESLLSKYYSSNSYSSAYTPKTFTASVSSSTASGSGSKTSSSSSSGSSKSSSSSSSGLSSYISSYLDYLDKKKKLDQISVEEEIALLENLQNYKYLNSEDEYELEYRLYKARQELQAQEDAELQERVDLAYAAYEKLMNDRIALINEETEAYKDATDERIAAIDAEIEARKRLNEDADRQAEIDAIDAQLEYAHLDELSRLELERKKQDLLDEQAEVDWERAMSDEKTALTESYNSLSAQNSEAISALTAALETAKNYFDSLTGSQSNSQIVSNYSDTRNIQIIQNALSDEQMVNKLLNALYSK